MFDFFKKLRQRVVGKEEKQEEQQVQEAVVSEPETLPVEEVCHVTEVKEEVAQEPEIQEVVSAAEPVVEIKEDVAIEEVVHQEQEPEEAEPEIQEEVHDYEEPSFKLSFDIFKEAISKTTEAISGGISSLVATSEEVDDDMIDELEEILIKSDVGVSLAAEITDRIRAQKKSILALDVKNLVKEEFRKVVSSAGANEINYKDGLNIFLVTGVNGAGKTTLIGKLAYRFKKYGAKVLVAAGDTFRAAAEEQLDIWSKRAGAEIVRRDGADSASVVFDAIKKAKEENFDVLLIDTAGRLQNKFNLMEELRKIKKVIDKDAEVEVAESILVIDANTGQNGLSQAEVFKEAVQITAVGLTKLDGSAKGGIIAGIAKNLNLPVKLIGVGEKMEDLKDFDADDFVNALFGD